jgi:predicted transposase YbfD/YdcC
LLRRLGADDGLKGGLVSIDAIACNATIAEAVRSTGADYFIAVKANQPTLLGEFDLFFKDADPGALDLVSHVDKGHGRIETRSTAVARQTEWLDGKRRFPGEFRMPGAAAIIRVQSQAELKDRCRFETRYYISSRTLSAEGAAQATRGHWAIENGLHWVLDVDFHEDQSRLRKGHGAVNMAIVRHFAFNLAQSAAEPPRAPRPLAKPRPNATQNPKKTSMRRRRKSAARSPAYLLKVLALQAR